MIPWDLVVQRVGGLLYLDVRDGCSLYDTTVCVCVRACVRACVVRSALYDAARYCTCHCITPSRRCGVMISVSRPYN